MSVGVARYVNKARCYALAGCVNGVISDFRLQVAYLFLFHRPLCQCRLLPACCLFRQKPTRF